MAPSQATHSFRSPLSSQSPHQSSLLCLHQEAPALTCSQFLTHDSFLIWPHSTFSAQTVFPQRPLKSIRARTFRPLPLSKTLLTSSVLCYVCPLLQEAFAHLVNIFERLLWIYRWLDNSVSSRVHIYSLVVPRKSLWNTIQCSRDWLICLFYK